MPTALPIDLSRTDQALRAVALGVLDAVRFPTETGRLFFVRWWRLLAGNGELDAENRGGRRQNIVRPELSTMGHWEVGRVP